MIFTPEQAEIRRGLNYDPDTGIFTHIKSHGSARAGGRAGCVRPNNGYERVSTNKRTLLAHRAAFIWMTGVCPKEVDHINGIRSDNRWCNLREVSTSENRHNIGGPRCDNRTTGLLGCHFNKQIGKFRASITVNGKGYHLGVFDTADEAHTAYLKAKNSLHPTHMRLRDTGRNWT